MKLAYRLKHGMEKLARLKNPLTFLIRCRNNDVVPFGLRVSVPLNSRGSKRIANRTSQALLRQLICDKRWEKAGGENEVASLKEELDELVSEEQRARLLEWTNTAVEEVASQTKNRQKQKFERLMNEKWGYRPTLDAGKVIKNLSKRELSAEEEQVLVLGLNFAVTPKQIPIADIIAPTEATARKMDALSANRLRAGVSEVLKGAKPPNSNLSGGMRRAVKSLKQDESIAILPADKGNATVVLDRTEYDDKLRSLLEGGDTYRKIPMNPTARMETKVTRMVKDLADKGYITDRQMVYLAPQHSTSPQMYRLPKIHKESVPLRPIVSTIGSPTYRLAKELARILSPLVGHTASIIKNFSHFVQGLG